MEQKETQRQERISRRKDDIEEGANQECPFAPMISVRSREISEKKKLDPIHLRYKKDNELKKQKLKLLAEKVEFEKLEKEKEGSLDKLSKKKKRAGGSQSRDIYEDNLKWLKEKQNKLMERSVEKRNQELEHYNFKPEINRDNFYYVFYFHSANNEQELHVSPTGIRDVEEV